MINIPNLPDNLNKIVVAFGLVLMSSCAYLLFAPSELKEQKNQIYKDNLSKNNEKLGEVIVDRKRLELNILRISAELSKKHGVKNLVYQDKDTIRLDSATEGESKSELVRDSLLHFWNQLEVLKFKSEQLTSITKNIHVDQKYYNDLEYINSLGFLFGFIAGGFLFSMGVWRWEKRPLDKIALGEKPVVEYESFCQSCARNFTYFLHRGKDQNGEESKLFCTDCFKDGDFTDYLTPESIDLYKHKIISSRRIGADKRRLKRRFKTPVRWKNDDFEKVV